MLLSMTDSVNTNIAIILFHKIESLKECIVIGKLRTEVLITFLMIDLESLNCFSLDL